MAARSLRAVRPAEPAAPRRLGTFALSANLLEARTREAITMLVAIRDGRLLVPPAARADRERHMAGIALLEMIEVRLRDALPCPAPENWVK